MKKEELCYRCQEESDDEFDPDKERWINPEEVAEDDDDDEDEEMDEM